MGALRLRCHRAGCPLRVCPHPPCLETAQAREERSKDGGERRIGPLGVPLLPCRAQPCRGGPWRGSRRGWSPLPRPGGGGARGGSPGGAEDPSLFGAAAPLPRHPRAHAWRNPSHRTGGGPHPGSRASPGAPHPREVPDGQLAGGESHQRPGPGAEPCVWHGGVFLPARALRAAHPPESRWPLRENHHEGLLPETLEDRAPRERKAGGHDGVASAAEIQQGAPGGHRGAPAAAHGVSLHHPPGLSAGGLRVCASGPQQAPRLPAGAAAELLAGACPACAWCLQHPDGRHPLQEVCDVHDPHHGVPRPAFALWPRELPQALTK